MGQKVSNRSFRDASERAGVVNPCEDNVVATAQPKKFFLACGDELVAHTVNHILYTYVGADGDGLGPYTLYRAAGDICVLVHDIDTVIKIQTFQSAKGFWGKQGRTFNAELRTIAKATAKDFEAFQANLRQEAMAQGTPALIAEARAQKMPEVQKVSGSGNRNSSAYPISLESYNEQYAGLCERAFDLRVGAARWVNTRKIHNAGTEFAWTEIVNRDVEISMNGLARVQKIEADASRTQRRWERHERTRARTPQEELHDLVHNTYDYRINDVWYGPNADANNAARAAARANEEAHGRPARASQVERHAARGRMIGMWFGDGT